MMAKLRCGLRTLLSMALIMGLSWFPVVWADLDDGLVKLASFTATPNENDIRLDWKTTSELNTAGYFVWRGECSNDSSNYNDIMQLSFDSARGNLSSGATYSRTDYSVISGTTYCYLLAEVKFDGKLKFHWNFIDSATAQ